MATVKKVRDALERFAPIEMKMDFDNVGLLAGFSGTPVDCALVSLDITEEVINEAIEKHAGLIVSHHPLFFSIKSVTDEDRTGRKLVRLLSNGISAICMHTNLDAARGGVNDALAKAVGIINAQPLRAEGTMNGYEYSYGRFGHIDRQTSVPEYLAFVKRGLNANGLRYHDAGRPVHRVAVAGGSGGDYLGCAIDRDCDTLITSDIKYDVFLAARECAVNLIDGDHFCTENVVVPVLRDYLKKEFPELEIRISDRHSQTAQFFNT